MTAINTALESITRGATQTYQNLEITPLLAPTPGTADYLTLDEAQEHGLSTVTEVDESGSVPTLLLENNADIALFLLDGEELIGAKQNRILNLTLLVPANTRLHIPVSCVERGRWRHNTTEFASAERTFFSKGRARKAARVSESLSMGGSRSANQSEVWSDIGAKMDALSVSSETDAIADAYEHFSGTVNDYVEAFHNSEAQVGACFAVNRKIRGMELFDVSDTCGKLMPKLIRSYALDAIEEQDALPKAVPQDRITNFLEEVAGAPVDTFDAIGEGEDMRLQSSSIAGGALAARGRLIHLCAFRQEAQADSAGGSRGGRFQQASLRFQQNY